MTSLAGTFEGIRYRKPHPVRPQPDIGSWDVSRVTTLAKCFYGSQFNPDISSWDTSRVTNMDSAFEESYFNHDVS